ncbi:MAG TPA: glycine zipper 2TM domain-containing protein [Paraburkholderia sp.]|jgi:outer membrane lipoprotein SlyB
MDKPNNTPSSSRRLHPLVATAAGAVIVASLAATAAITGLFPKASSDSAQSNQTQAAQIALQPASQPVVDTAQPAAQQQQQQPAAQQAQQQQPMPAPVPVPVPAQPQYAQQPQPAPQPQQYAPPQQAPRPAVCSSCGTVIAISEVRQEGHGTGIGAVGGAVAGGVIGNQFGRGGGRTAMTLLGAVGGGFAGNSVEKHLRTTSSYSVRVRMENGHIRYFTYHEAPPFQQGERVRIENGTLVAG